MTTKLLNHPLFQRFWHVAGAVSIRVKVLGIVLGVIILLGIFVTLQMRGLLTGTLEERLLDQGTALAGQFANGVAPIIQSGDYDAARMFLNGRQAHYSSAGHNTLILYISIEGATQQVSTWDTGAPTLPVENAVDIAVPIDGTDAIMHLGVADITVERTVTDVTQRLLVITLLMLAFGFVAAFFLTWILTRPIYDLVAATQAVAAGDFQQHVPRWADDEIGELAEAFNSMTESLAQADVERAEREQLRSQYVTNVIAAQEDERKRIARELHDSTGQSLTSLLVGLRNLRDLCNADAMHDVPDRIDALRDIVAGTLDEVRQMAWQLRPSVLDDLGLIAALELYIDGYQQRFGVQVDFLAKGIDQRLPLELETTIYRVIQEALTNVARHAQASTVSVIIDHRADTIRIIIEDDGVGFAPSDEQPRKSLGLQGIRERAMLFGGSLTIETEVGSGTTLFVEIPYIRPVLSEVT